MTKPQNVLSADPAALNVGALIALAQTTALRANSEIHVQWIKGSFSLASAAGLGEIAYHLQEIGKLDLLLRSLEADAVGQPVSNEPSIPDMLSFDFQALLSRQWVLSAYETLRTISERWTDVDGRMAELLRRLELVRVPLAKLRIAKDRNALGKAGSVELIRRGDPPDKPGQTYTANGTTTYWPQTVFDSTTGSVGWDVIDLRNQGQADVLRRDLSDEFLRLMDTIKAPEKT